MIFIIFKYPGRNIETHLLTQWHEPRSHIFKFIHELFFFKKSLPRIRNFDTDYKRSSYLAKVTREDCQRYIDHTTYQTWPRPLYRFLERAWVTGRVSYSSGASRKICFGIPLFLTPFSGRYPGFMTLGAAVAARELKLAIYRNIHHQLQQYN